jgi:Fic family protein
MDKNIDNILLKQLNAIKVDIQPNKKLNLFLAKKDKVDYIFNTSALEGNAMTYPEVETLLDGITIGGHKLSDEHMILNQNRSVSLLFNLLEKEPFILSKEIHLQLHSEVAKEEALSWGVFRDNNVRIGGTEYLPPKHHELEKTYHDNYNFLLQITHPIIQAFCTFLLSAKAQYFYDGNKRTARLMMNGILLDAGYPMLNIKAKDKLEFNKTMINYYDNDKIVKAVEYLFFYYIKQVEEL